MSQNTTPQNKLTRVIKKYDLHGLGDELETSWVGEGSHRSVRDLADYVNSKVLDAALRQNDVILDKDQVETIAERLSSDENPLTAEHLKDRGVNIGQVKSDFVSYQTIHNYLCDVREVEFTPETNTKADRIKTLRKLQSRIKTIHRQSVTQSINREEISGSVPNFQLDVKVQCPRCNSKSDVLIYMHNGGCPSPECS